MITKALEKHRKTNSVLKCKKCVLDAEQKEREAAAKRAETKSKTKNTTIAGSSNADTLTCASCKKPLSLSSFNRNQAAKGEGKARCRACVDKALADEEKERLGSKADRIAAARENVRVAERSGNPMAVVKAESELSALEAEHVTGLKPMVIGRRGGRGTGVSNGGRGRGKGRGSYGRRR